MSENYRTNMQALLSAVQELRGPLLRYATSLVGPDRAEDVLQEAYVRLLSNRQPVRQVPQWLFTVCRNIALDFCRKDGRMNTTPQDHADNIQAAEPSPVLAAQRSEAVAAVLKAVGELSPNQQEVIRLKFQNEFSYRQIAEITGLTAGNVGFLIHTAIKTLRRTLGEGLLAGEAARSEQ